MLVFPFFTYARRDGQLGAALPQALFYARLGADIAGRLATRRGGAAASARSLALWAAAKAALTPAVMAALLGRGGDLAALALVAAFWALSGYVNTCAYLLAPSLVPAAARSRAGGLMAASFQGACLAGLLAAVAAERLAMPLSAPPEG
jgi:hypothetical protein